MTNLLGHNKEDWQHCLDWMVRCKIINPKHMICKPESNIFDFMKILKDGVIICVLLNNLKMDAISLNDFCTRTNRSEFLSLRNIRRFLLTCKKVFNIDILFNPDDLFKQKDLKMVIITLALLSKSSIAEATGIKGFYNDIKFNEKSLPQLERKNHHDDYYDEKCSAKPMTPLPVMRKVSTLEYCLFELIESEQKYVSDLRSFIDVYYTNLKGHISDVDLEYFFGIIKKLYCLNYVFEEDLLAALSKQRNAMTLSGVIFKWKKPFLLYGDYMLEMPKMEAYLKELLMNNDLKKYCYTLKESNNICQIMDMFLVPFQRLLKYNLFFKTICDNSATDPEINNLRNAENIIQDLAQFINKSKTDLEKFEYLKTVKDTLLDFDMSTSELHEYGGQLIQEGNLIIQRPFDKKNNLQMVYLFERVMLICNIKKKKVPTATLR